MSSKSRGFGSVGNPSPRRRVFYYSLAISSACFFWASGLSGSVLERCEKGCDTASAQILRREHLSSSGSRSAEPRMRTRVRVKLSRRSKDAYQRAGTNNLTDSLY
jgi:hypothetical protein